MANIIHRRLLTGFIFSLRSAGVISAHFFFGCVGGDLSFVFRVSLCPQLTQCSPATSIWAPQLEQKFELDYVHLHVLRLQFFPGDEIQVCPLGSPRDLKQILVVWLTQCKFLPRSSPSIYPSATEDTPRSFYRYCGSNNPTDSLFCESCVKRVR